MAVAKVIELTSSSPKSFEDALGQGIARASKTVENIKGAWVQEQSVTIEDGKIKEYRTNLKITFVLNEMDDE